MNCASCGTQNHDTASYCRHCGHALATTGALAAPPEGQTLHAPSKFPVGKSPVAAVFFSFLVPGIGQFYNGDFKRGLLILILSAVSISLAPGTFCLSTAPFFGLWIWGMVNAYNVAARKTPLWA